MNLYQIADELSSGLNPGLVLLVLEEPLLVGGLRPSLRFWGRTLLSAGVAVVLAESGKHYQVWAGHPNFPSGHTTLATSLVTCLILQRGPKWALLGIPCALTMAWALAYGHWHTVDEVIAGLILGSIVPFLLWRLTNRFSKR